MRDTQSFATGGWGPDENFREPGSGEIGESLTKTHSSFETPCGSYAHFKITRYLLRVTRDSRYGDSMERVLYNCILGAKPIQAGRARLLLLRLQQRRSEVLSPVQVALLHGNFLADHGGLRNQFVLPRWRRHLREPLCAVAREVGSRQASGWR